jgi:hypothetical protein
MNDTPAIFLISKLVPLDGAEKLDDKTLWYLMQNVAARLPEI